MLKKKNEALLLSIIIPCYNSFAKMQKGLQQLEKLPKFKVEIIIVDDCSTDDSFERLKFYSKQSALNFNIIKKKTNLGPGSSRNKGIELAKGKYITFMDADDYLDDMFWSVVSDSIFKDYDCIIFDAYFTMKKKEFEDKNLSMFFVNHLEGIVDKKRALATIRGGTWGKIYRREIITANKICFVNQKVCEDLSFTITAISKCSTIFYIKNGLYHYVQDKGSIMHQNKIRERDIENAFIPIRKQLEDEYYEEFTALFIRHYLYRLVTTSEDLTLLTLKKYTSKTEQICPEYMNNNYLRQERWLYRLIIKMIIKEKILCLKMINLIKVIGCWKNEVNLNENSN